MNQQIIESLLNRISALERRQAEMTLNAVQPRHNLAAGAAPLVTDDITLGYSAGSVWIFGTDIYICSSGAAGAAVWDIVNGGSGFGGDVDDLTTNTGVAGQMVRVAALGGLEYRSTSQVRTDIGATTIGGNVFTSANPSAISFARANADNSFSWLSASAFRTAIGATTVGGNLFTATNPSAITFLRVNADNTVSFLSATDFITALNLSGLYVTIGTSQTVTATKSWSALQTFLAGIRIGDNSTANLGIQFSVPGVNWDFATGTGGNLTLGNGNGAYVTFITASIISQFFGQIGMGIATPTGRLHVVPPAANQKGVVIQGVTSQSDNLLEFWDVSNNVLAYIDANGIPSWGTTLAVMFHAESDGTITLTDQPNSAQFLSNSSRNIWQVDLVRHKQVRIVARVTTGSASANSPRLIARYKTVASGFSTTVGDYVDIGTSEVSASLTNTGVIASSWIAITASALADIFIAMIQDGGNGAADPAYAMLGLQFR